MTAVAAESLRYPVQKGRGAIAWHRYFAGGFFLLELAGFSWPELAGPNTPCLVLMMCSARSGKAPRAKAGPGKVLRLDHGAGCGVDILPQDAVARRPVDLPA
jgi:hypothetical protein